MNEIKAAHKRASSKDNKATKASGNGQASCNPAKSVRTNSAGNPTRVTKKKIPARSGGMLPDFLLHSRLGPPAMFFAGQGGHMKALSWVGLVVLLLGIASLLLPFRITRTTELKSGIQALACRYVIMSVSPRSSVEY